jgi:hypothetical protein
MSGRATIQRRLARNAVIAAIIGTSGGAVAGLWTVGRGASPEPSTAKPSVTTAAAPGTASSEHVSSASSLGTTGQRTVKASRPRIESGDDVLERARALAQRADVKALVALREAVVQRAEARGDSTSPTSSPTIADIDRRLAEARLLRLKLDADEFRSGGMDATRRR